MVLCVDSKPIVDYTQCQYGFSKQLKKSKNIFSEALTFYEIYVILFINDSI